MRLPPNTTVCLFAAILITQAVSAFTTTHAPAASWRKPRNKRQTQAATTAISSMKSRVGKKDDNDPASKAFAVKNKKALRARNSIRSCYRAALTYVVVDLVTTLYQNNDGVRAISRIGGLKDVVQILRSVENVQIVRSLAYLNFGAGLWYASSVYEKAVREGNGSLKASSLYGVLQKTSYVWKSTALFVVNMSAIVMHSIKDFTNQDVWGYAGPLVVLFLALVGRFRLQGWSDQVVKSQGAVPLSEISSLNTSSSSSAVIDSANIRAMGFKSAQCMAFCMGSFYMLGIALCFVTVTMKASPLKRMFTIPDIVTPIVTGKLLGTLHNRLVAAMIECTKGLDGKGDSMVTVNSNRFLEFNDAQASVYNRIAGTMNKNTIVGKIAPLIVGAVKTKLQ